MEYKLLGILNAIIDELDKTCYAIVGDWNANLKYIDNSLFANHMLNFCSEYNLKCRPVFIYRETLTHILVNDGVQTPG